MSITYTISSDKTVIYEVWAGDVSAEDLRDYWTKYLQDPGVMAIRRTLVDLRQAYIRFNGAQLSGLVASIVVPALLVGESV